MINFHTKIDETVLVIGAAEASDVDMAIQISRVAKRVTFTQNIYSHLRKELHQKHPEKVTIMHGVKRFTSDGTEFIDGTRQSFTVIIYATGKTINLLKGIKE